MKRAKISMNLWSKFATTLPKERFFVVSVSLFMSRRRYLNWSVRFLTKVFSLSLIFLLLIIIEKRDSSLKWLWKAQSEMRKTRRWAQKTEIIHRTRMNNKKNVKYFKDASWVTLRCAPNVYLFGRSISSGSRIYTQTADYARTLIGLWL